jgi:hypothetical protein
MTANVELHSTVHTGPLSPFLSTTVSASPYIPLHGCVISGLQSMATKATSPLHLAAQRSTIFKLLHTLVFIIMYPKASSFRRPRTLRSPSMLEAYLLDPDLMDDRTSDESAISTSRYDFGTRVRSRDRTCVMTATHYVQACHIVPHAKGHQVCLNISRIIPSSHSTPST